MEQQNLLVKCPEDFQHVVTGYTGAAWTQSAVQWRSQYKICANRHNSLVEAVLEYDRAQ